MAVAEGRRGAGGSPAGSGCIRMRRKGRWGRFYRRIAQGSTVTEAVSSVRRGLMDTPERVTMYGRRVFWDWQLPWVYQSRNHQPPVIAQVQPDPLAAPVIHPEEAPTDRPPDSGCRAVRIGGPAGRTAATGTGIESALSGAFVRRHRGGQDGTGAGAVPMVPEAGARRLSGRRVLYGV